ncbi:hypothetical protein DHEL01_v205744 [Diaporthe helianthi]|uniref:Acetyl-coenzyme A carboxylase carboxyl transferase subunit beta domain-containing protein n=1 Tax=Diaporthe helianthi TaxID=158607 RepID=A0A2P5I011_DIAHE|nr:hypothetical protein DHEL01_v205744 [Diaporthe helianthi]
MVWKPSSLADERILTASSPLHERVVGVTCARNKQASFGCASASTPSSTREASYEVGSVARTIEWRTTTAGKHGKTKDEVQGFTPSNNVQGFGTVGGHRILFTADDFSLRTGHADGGGGRSHGVAEQLSLGTPNVGAVLGPAIGLGAMRVTAYHFSVMASDMGSLFNAGPHVVERATSEDFEGLTADQKVHLVLSGATDALGAQNMTRHLNLCDVFNLPLIQFVDCPGYTIGTAAERRATVKDGVELGMAYYSTIMPIFNVLIRKCYGVAGGLMADCRDPHNRVAWPSLESGSLPLEGGIKASHSRELNEEGDKRAEVYDKLMDEYTRL